MEKRKPELDATCPKLIFALNLQLTSDLNNWMNFLKVSSKNNLLAEKWLNYLTNLNSRKTNLDQLQEMMRSSEQAFSAGWRMRRFGWNLLTGQKSRRHVSSLIGTIRYCAQRFWPPTSSWSTSRRSNSRQLFKRSSQSWTMLHGSLSAKPSSMARPTSSQTPQKDGSNSQPLASYQRFGKKFNRTCKLFLQELDTNDFIPAITRNGKFKRFWKQGQTWKTTPWPTWLRLETTSSRLKQPTSLEISTSPPSLKLSSLDSRPALASSSSK